ncbi:MAG: glycerol dehydratase reactivase beta/small subunit family protein [Cellulosilyticaceae bacterium]
MIRPEIVIKVYEDKEDVTQEVLAGIEEEGILYHVIPTNIHKEGVILAKEAAEESQLEVGIGICNEEVVLTVHKLRGKALLETKTQYRELGQNAARYVKGNSFKG